MSAVVIYRGRYAQDYIKIGYNDRAVIRTGRRWRHWSRYTKTWLVDQIDREYWEQRILDAGLEIRVIEGDEPPRNPPLDS